MLEQYLNQIVTLIPTIRSVYGDIVIDPNGEKKQLHARFRVIEASLHSNNREERRSDESMVWFDPHAPIVQNSIFFYEGQYWMVNKINEARRLGSTRVEFLKCWCAAHQVVS